MEKEEFRVYKDTRYNPKGALWEVSNYGNVRKNGDVYIPSELINGYLAFGSKYYVHRAVAELFIPNTDSKPTVDHIDRDKHNNHSSNLRWATYKEQSENIDWETLRMKISAAQVGRTHSEETKAKMRAAALGYKHTLGKVWVFNPTTEHLTRVNPSQLTEYLDKGYIKGQKIKK